MFEYGTIEGTDEFVNPNLSHSADALRMSHRMIEKFVQLARKSTHVGSTELSTVTTM